MKLFSLNFFGALGMWLFITIAAHAQVPPSPTVTGGNPGQNPHNKAKRWQWGGNFSVLLNDPLLVDASPTLAYNLSRKFRVGVGANYRYSFFKTNDSSTQVYGGNAFMQFQPIPWFFMSGEYEVLNVANPEAGENTPARIWQQSPLLGAGIRFRLLRLLHINVSLMRDFNYQKGISPYPSPWRFRMGFSL